jgi:hypothetical protein
MSTDEEKKEQCHHSIWNQIVPSLCLIAGATIGFLIIAPVLSRYMFVVRDGGASINLMYSVIPGKVWGVVLGLIAGFLVARLANKKISSR